MPDYDYQPPVSSLLTLGERPLRKREPHDYRAMGITPDHLAELTRMSRDPAFHGEDGDNGLEVYAPVHAMRAMIQLGGEATIEPLARLLEFPADTDDEEINEWFLEEIPDAFAQLGVAAISRIAVLMRDSQQHTHSRVAAATALEKIAQRHPHARAECLTLLTEAIEQFEVNDPDWNGWLIAMLVHLKGVEAAPAIKRAFDADRVDETIVGDWDEVQAALGLRGPLSDEELAEKAKKRRAAHGWLSPEEMLSDEELVDEMLEGFIDQEEAADAPANGNEFLDEPDEPNERERMRLPEEFFTADQRRELAQMRKNERKAAERARERDKQQKRRK
jgi:hypothetical protein